MPSDSLRRQRACRTYARESRNAVLCLLAAIALTLSGIFAALVSAPVDAATKARVEVQAETTR